ncbi:MAG TPA: hypothetical protein VNW92_31775 [Polyangiaceae bacterium]|jgi:tetratricopeptide (TPR) repeat protein|nr:hypothetical protein [Polyangiaceae bacterium]
MTAELTISEQIALLRIQAEAALAHADRPSALGLMMKAFELDEDAPLSLSLIDRISFVAPDPEALLAVDADSRSLFRRAVRARVMMNLGQRLEATRAMVQVVERAPHRPFMVWLVPWLDREACLAIGLSGLKSMVLSLIEFASQYPVPTPDGENDLSPVCVSLLRAGTALLSVIRNAYPDEPQLYFGEVLLRRRLGEPKATLEVAQRGVERFPSDWGCLTAMLNALGDAAQPDEALRYAERALSVDPSDGSPLYDAGLAFLHQERGADAAQVFSELVARFQGYPGAAEAHQRARALDE